MIWDWDYEAIIVAVPLGLIGFSAPFGTTILGLVAISQIRHSAGRLYGMGLAVFDALLYPILLLDALFVLLFRAGGAARLGVAEGIILVLAVDVGIVILVWRPCRLPVDGKGGRKGPQAATGRQAASSAATPARRRLGIVSLALCVAGVLLMFVASVVALVVQPDNTGITMLGYLAFLGLEVAALVCGIVAWSATPLAKAGAIAAGVLMAGSVLFL